MEMEGIYRVWHPEDSEEEYSSFSAHGPEHAAVEFAGELCAGDPDYYRAFEDGEELLVRSVLSGKLVRIEVTVEAQPVFHAGCPQPVEDSP